MESEVGQFEGISTLYMPWRIEPVLNRASGCRSTASFSAPTAAAAGTLHVSREARGKTRRPSWSAGGCRSCAMLRGACVEVTTAQGVSERRADAPLFQPTLVRRRRRCRSIFDGPVSAPRTAHYVMRARALKKDRRSRVTSGPACSITDNINILVALPLSAARTRHTRRSASPTKVRASV